MVRLLSIRRVATTAAVLFALPVTGSAQANQPPADSMSPSVRPTAGIGGLVTLGSVAEERIRLRQLLGRAESDGYLLRSAHSLTGSPPANQRITGLGVRLTTAWNSDLPFSLNDGAMWAGRGLNTQVSAGFRIDVGRVSLVLAPQLSRHANRDFQTFPFNRNLTTGRSAFSSPWYDRPNSIDLPSRFGADPFTSADLGQSILTLDLGPVALGAATQELWWGPGIRNALLISNNAPGIPHLFIRTGRPLPTPIGNLEGYWILGRLAESDYFDDMEANDVRSLSSAAVTFSPRIERNLTVGFARSVYAPARGGLSPLAAFDVFRDVGQPNARDESVLLREPAADQILSVFGRWLFPASGLEAYVEWARYEQLASLRDLLLLPHHSSGYTVGMQWGRELGPSNVLRLQAEASNLEPSSTYRQRPITPWYTSKVVRQGYTHRGQLIGAAIGPGASSQWLAADLFVGDRARVGAFGGRIRWDDNAFYTQPYSPFIAHDVSVFAGLRLTHRVLGMDISGEYITQARLNYLYQNLSTDINSRDPIDVGNQTLRLTITPTLADHP